MLEILIEPGELWDEAREEFISLNGPQLLKLEHSLISISKWEAKWKKPFLTTNNRSDDKTPEQLLDYVQCMSINKIDSKYYLFLSKNQIAQINKYINDSMTATTINEKSNQGGRREILTSEVIYYYMIALGIPFECEKWHLNRLITLIKVCSIKNSNGGKMSQKEVMAQNRKINEMRKREYHTKG